MTARTATPDPVTKSVPSEQFYDELLKNAASYNKRLCQERKMRLPFLDSQTGVAQRHTNLFVPYRYRLPGKAHGQLYSYPCKRWKRKKGCLPFSNLNMAKHANNENMPDTEYYNTNSTDNTETKQYPERETEKPKTEYQYYYDDYENLSEPPDAGEIEHRDSDSSDFEETYVKKKKRKAKAKGGRGGKGKAKEKKDVSFSVPKPTYDETKTSYDEDHEKPYSCDKLQVETTKQGGSENPPEPQGKYCDFCLGDAVENKKTGQREELVSCSDCGRSGHPTCLQFTANMIVSVKKYPWQCIECKTCGVCGTSENDDQLLFCDDCDRGFHMYCLQPPLSHPPEGNWSCHLCIEEFYNGQKPEGME